MSLSLSSAQLSTLNSQPFTESQRRNGKIARLPKETRDMINRMLEDGLPYPVIIDELGAAGEGLNTQNLTNWKQGGYQDYLRTQALIETIKAQTETAIDILRETGDLDTSKIKQACDQVAAIQLFTFLRDHGDAALRTMVLGNPARYLSILNIVCRLSGSALAHEKFSAALPQPPQAPAKLLSPQIKPSGEPSSQIKINQA
jgi:hypothetical protein